MFLAPTLLDLNLTREQFMTGVSSEAYFVVNRKGYEIWFDPQREAQDVGGWLVYAPIGIVPDFSTIRYTKDSCIKAIDNVVAEYNAQPEIGTPPETPTDVTYSITWKTTDGGIVAVSGTHIYAEGTQVLLKTNPNDGYVLDYWTKDGKVLPESTYAVIASSDMVLVAYFKLAPTETVISPDEIPSDVIEKQLEEQPVEELETQLNESNPLWSTFKLGGVGLSLICGMMWLRAQKEVD